jgi:GAF domain-containing protein
METPHRNDGSHLASELFEVLLPDVPLTDVLDRVVGLAVRTIPGCAFAGITMSQHGQPQTPVYTDERSPRVDQVQYDNDSGPCLDAFRSGDLNLIVDTTSEKRWPAFCQAAAAVGICSTLSVPMDLEGNREELVGALNLYSERAGAFDDDAVTSARSYAQQAAILVANARAYWGAKEQTEQLTQALESRATIEQAKGVLMCESGMDPDAAFQILVRASQRENRKLRVIAAEIVERTQRPHP